jgi:YrbI family 3-deoxy-D-manno-octulosonate 8-phosphate phosphatase
MSIKLIISDIDGVWTDGGMYYFNNGQEAKKFNTSDSVGVSLASMAKIDIVIISGEDIPALRNRLTKLNILNYHLAVKNKVAVVEKLAAERKIEFDEMAFIGDEINDHALLKKVGFSACPNSAPEYTKKIVDFITPSKGGMGAFRDFVIEVLRREDMLKKSFKLLLNNEHTN